MNESYLRRRIAQLTFPSFSPQLGGDPAGAGSLLAPYSPHRFADVTLGAPGDFTFKLSPPLLSPMDALALQLLRWRIAMLPDPPRPSRVNPLGDDWQRQIDRLLEKPLFTPELWKNADFMHVTFGAAPPKRDETKKEPDKEPPPASAADPVAAAKEPDANAIYTFTATQGTEPKNRTTIEYNSMLGFGPFQYNYTLLGRRSYNNLAWGALTTGGPGATSIGLIGHAWTNSWHDLVAGGIAQVNTGSFTDDQKKIIRSTGFTGTGHLSWNPDDAIISADVNLLGSRFNTMQFGDPSRTINDVTGFGYAADLSLHTRSGRFGVTAEGLGNWYWGRDPATFVSRGGVGLGAFGNWRLGKRAMLFGGIYGGFSWEKGTIDRYALKPQEYEKKSPSLGLTLGIGLF